MTNGNPDPPRTCGSFIAQHAAYPRIWPEEALARTKRDARVFGVSPEDCKR